MARDKQIVLSVEDNDADFYLIEMALQECSNQLTINRFSDGEQAIHFCENSQDEDDTLPNLILLDANLPRHNGFEVLQAMKSTKALREIPIVMFTSSSNVVEKRRALELGANDFVTKSDNFDQMMSTLGDICSRLLK